MIPDSLTVSMLPRKRRTKRTANQQIKPDIPDKGRVPQRVAAVKRALNGGLTANKCGTVS